MSRVKPGVQFRHVVGDERVLFEVERRDGPETWIAVAVDEPWEFEGETIPSDYAGMVSAFTTAHIESILAMDDAWVGIQNKTEEFYASLESGEIVHYHNGFGEYVRCEVVEEGGHNVLQPIALVGAWRPMDLPHRWPDGRISVPYHAEKVLNRTGAWRPSHSTVYEYDPEAFTRDPTELEPIDLSVPEMTSDERTKAALIQKLKRITDAIEGSWSNPKEALARVREIIEEDDQ